MRRPIRIWIILLAIAALPGVSRAADGINWSSDYKMGLEEARIERKPVMIDFYTLWCYYCKVLDARTYTDPGVIASAKDFVCLKINAERERRLASEFRIAAYPIIVFLSRDGMEAKRLYGYQTGATLKRELDKILTDPERLEMLAQAYKKAPKDAEAAYAYSDELMARGQFKDARKILEKALRNPKQIRKADIVLDLAICRYKTGGYKQAVKELANFSNRFKESGRIYEAELYYGLSLLASGERDKGVKALDELQKRASDRWVGQEAMRQLKLVGRG